MRRTLHWGVVAAEVEERDDEIIVRLEAPGLEPGNFDISIVNGRLLVRGEKRMEREQKRGCYQQAGAYRSVSARHRRSGAPTAPAPTC